MGMLDPPGVAATALPPHLKGWRLWIGLQVEEPGAIKNLGTIEMQAPYGVGERTFEPQAFYIHYLLGIGQS